MKYPSRWGKPAQPCITAQQQSSQLPAVPPPPVHTTREETSLISQEVVPFPTCNAHQVLFSWFHCPLRALPWVQVGGHLPLGRTQLEHLHQEPAFLLTLLHALHLEPGIQRQNGSAVLHGTTIQRWEIALCSRVNVMMAESAPGCSSQGHHQRPKLLSIVTSGWSWPMRKPLVLL